MIAEYASVAPSESFWSAEAKLCKVSSDAYHIGIEIKTNNPGDEKGEGRGAIERASTQVLRGVNGFVEYFRQALFAVSEPWEAIFVPVIFTTARLFTSSVKLGAADLKTGKIDAGEVKEADWVCYQYHLSPGIKHAASYLREPTDLGKVLDREYIRTIIIVGAAGIDKFLWEFNPARFDIEPMTC